MRIAVLLLFICINIACKKEQAWPLRSMDSASINEHTFLEKKLNLFVFVAPGCSLSEAVILDIKSIDQTFQKDLQTFLIIPGNLFSDKEIDSFKIHYGITLPILIDTARLLQNKFNAEITPEAILTNKDLEVLYQGAINDRAVDINIIKQNTTHNYLFDAIYQKLNNQIIIINKTKPVGCFIE